MKSKEKALIFLYSLIFLFMLASLLIVYSASFIIGIRLYNNGNYFIIKQFLAYIVGILLFFIFLNIDYRNYKKYWKAIFLIGAFLLLLVLIPGIGHKVKGAARWIKIGPISIQPAEYAKIFFILSFAGFLSFAKEKFLFGHNILIRAFSILGIYAGLIYFEKDLGTILIIVSVAFFMLTLTNIKLKDLIFYIIPVGLFGIFATLKEQHRISRIKDYIDGLKKYGVGGGYQVEQSIIGIVNGGFLGLGYSNGRQKYFYLPEVHTDFIFSVIVEEIGFIGVLVLIFAYVLFLYVGIEIGKNAKDNYGRYVALGITSYVIVQAILNISVAIGLIPAKGVTLPFISYGGSSIITTMILVGILANILKKGDLK